MSATLSTSMSTTMYTTMSATRWHHLHQLKIWPPGSATYFSWKFGLQVAPLALLEIQLPGSTTCIKWNLSIARVTSKNSSWVIFTMSVYLHVNLHVDNLISHLVMSASMSITNSNINSIKTMPYQRSLHWLSSPSYWSPCQLPCR